MSQTRPPFPRAWYEIAQLSREAAWLRTFNAALTGLLASGIVDSNVARERASLLADSVHGSMQVI